MLTNRCPFCGNLPNETFVNGIYIIECLSCKQKGIQIRVENSIKDEAKLLWNTRYIDTYISENKTQVLAHIEDYLTGKVLKDDITEILNLNKRHIGYFILNNGLILNCKDNHIKELLKYLGIETDNNELNDASICQDFKVTRISIYDNVLLIALPKIYNRLQIVKCFEVIEKENTLLKASIIRFEINYFKKDNYCLYSTNNINDFLLKLDTFRRRLCRN